MVPVPITLVVLFALMCLAVNNIALLRGPNMQALQRQQIALLVIETIVFVGGLVAMAVWPQLLFFWQ
jgi:hypothetical protein